MAWVRIVYWMDKSVSVIYPDPKSKRLNETEEEWLKRSFAKSMQGELKGLPHDDIDSSELPQSREDRSAWTGEKGRGVSVDQVKAANLRADKESKAKIDERVRDIAVEGLKDDGGLSQDYKADQI